MDKLIAVVGCGGLGVPAAWTLAVGGASRLRLVDPDRVEIANLHRQIAFTPADVGRQKAEALAAFLQARCPSLCVEVAPERLDAGNLSELLDDCDAVLEGSDDAATKFVVNDWAIGRRRVATIAAAIARRGQWFTVRHGGACYRCLFEAPPPADLTATCAVAGVLGPAVGQVGGLAARSLLATLAGRRDPADSALCRLDSRGLLRTAVDRAADCPCAGAAAS